MSTDHQQPTDLSRASRRHVVAGGIGACGLAALLSACGSSDSGATGGTGGTAGSGSSSAGGSGGSSSGTKAQPGGLVSASQVPVGGAVSATDAQGNPVIVAQASQGRFTACSAVCTHAGCTVQPDGSELKCPCHGSTFDLSGKNTGGPAPSPLPAISVKVEKGEVVEA